MVCRSSLKQLNREQFKVRLGAGVGGRSDAEAAGLHGLRVAGKHGCSRLVQLIRDSLDCGGEHR